MNKNISKKKVKKNVKKKEMQTIKEGFIHIVKCINSIVSRIICSCPNCKESISIDLSQFNQQILNKKCKRRAKPEIAQELDINYIGG
jgi:hypothetical protein